MNVKCDKCGAECVPSYGVTPGGEKHCFTCCAQDDENRMRDTGLIALYFGARPQGGHEVVNWPGTLRFRVVHYRKGRHNIARTRYDAWFVFEGYYWHGVMYGENTQLMRCKRTKEKAQ